jgi:hypothetical protein
MRQIFFPARAHHNQIGPIFSGNTTDLCSGVAPDSQGLYRQWLCIGHCLQPLLYLGLRLLHQPYPRWPQHLWPHDLKAVKDMQEEHVRFIPCSQHKSLLENVRGVCREIGGHENVVDFHWCSFYRSGY